VAEEYGFDDGADDGFFVVVEVLDGFEVGVRGSDRSTGSKARRSRPAWPSCNRLTARFGAPPRVAGLARRFRLIKGRSHRVLRESSS
jgi:hypothetical protein